MRYTFVVCRLWGGERPPKRVQNQRNCQIQTPCPPYAPNLLIILFKLYYSIANRYNYNPETLESQYDIGGGDINRETLNKVMHNSALRLKMFRIGKGPIWKIYFRSTFFSLKLNKVLLFFLTNDVSFYIHGLLEPWRGFPTMLEWNDHGTLFSRTPCICLTAQEKEW